MLAVGFQLNLAASLAPFFAAALAAARALLRSSFSCHSFADAMAVEPPVKRPPAPLPADCKLDDVRARLARDLDIVVPSRFWHKGRQRSLTLDECNKAFNRRRQHMVGAVATEDHPY